MLKTGAQYIEEIKAMRPNVYKWGKLIEDVTTDPNTSSHIQNVARCYDACFDPEKRDIYSCISKLTGERAHRWNTLMSCAQDLADNMRLKRDNFRTVGHCTGITCAGWTVLNALYATTYELDQEFQTDYHQRVHNFLLKSEREGLALCAALTDAKGDRSKKPGQQEDPDVYLHIVEEREDGVVVSGFKNMICSVAGAQYICVIPTTSLAPDEGKFAIAAAVRRDAEGLTIVETRLPSDTRMMEEGYDGIKSGTTQAYLLFDHVFIPKENVFICGQTAYAGKCLTYFTSIYRACIGGCVSGQGDMMVGAALGLARANGLKRKTFQDKLNRMAINNENSFATGMGAIQNGALHPSGVYIPDAILANVSKVLAATLPAETKMLAIEIAGGLAETGCIPSYTDLKSPLYGETLLRSLKAGCDPEDRVRLARLLEWLTAGPGLSGCLHGGGSPDTARMMINAKEPWDECVECAKALCGATSPLVDKK